MHRLNNDIGAEGQRRFNATAKDSAADINNNAAFTALLSDELDRLQHVIA